MIDDKKFQYAVPCIWAKQPFFVKFLTKNKDEAIRFASCVYGEKAIDRLVRLEDDGTVNQVT